MSKISIIIPVYNSEKYISRCLDSIFAQTFSDFEIIVIDDGSRDHSYDVVKEYKDQRIRLYRQKNQGIAKTRNRGIELVKGKYLTFVDNDDFLDPDYLQRFYDAIISTNADLVIGGFRRTNCQKTLYSFKISSGDFAKYTIIAPWAKLYRTSFIHKHHLEFLDSPIGEDVYFSCQLYNHNPKITKIDYIGYNWYYNNKSVSNTDHRGFQLTNEALNLARRIKAPQESPTNTYYIVRLLFWYLLYSGKSVSPKIFQESHREIFAWLDHNLKNWRKNLYLRHMPDGETRKVWLTIRVYLIIVKLKLLPLFARIYCRGGEAAA